MPRIYTREMSDWNEPDRYKLLEHEFDELREWLSPDEEEEEELEDFDDEDEDDDGLDLSEEEDKSDEDGAGEDV